MSDESLVCDTTVLLYLNRIEMLKLLPSLFKDVYVPSEVVLELDMGRLLRNDTIDPRKIEWVQIIEVSWNDIEKLPKNRLGKGERAVIAYAQSKTNCIVGLDDRLARLLAEEQNIRIVGTIGLLLKAKEAGLISVVRPFLESLLIEGFHLSSGVYQETLTIAGESLT